MERFRIETRHIPSPLPESWARGLAALSIVIFGLAVLGGFLYDGWHRIAYVTAFTAMGVANLALALGNLLPEGPVARRLLIAVGPLTIVMLLALGASLAFRTGCGS